MIISEQPASADAPYSLFVGCAALLQSLRMTLLAERVAVLIGEPGSGKTALARAYARSFAREYTHVIWLDAAAPEVLMASILTQGQHFPLFREVAQKGFAGLNEIIEEWTGEPNTLLVLDNVLFPVDAPLSLEQRPIGGHVLLIGRNVECQPAASCLTMKTLDAREGALLLLLLTRRLAPDAALEPANDEQYRLALELARELASSPLALTLAGGYLNVTGCNLQDYLFAYRDCPERPEISSNADMQMLEIVCDLTLARLAESQPAALRVLQACTLLSPSAIPRALFQQENLQQTLFSKESGQMRQVIQTLLASKLLDAQDETDTFSMPPLLQMAIRQTFSQEQQHRLREQLLVACLQLALSYEAEKQEELPALCFSLAGHIHRLATDSGETSFSLKETADAYTWAASLLGGQGLVREAEALLRKALSIWEHTAGYSYPSVAGALFYLAIFNAQLQQYVEAEMYAQRALTTTAQVLGVNHFRVLACLNTLANIYQQQGKLRDASLCYQKVLSIGERVGLQQHPLYFAARKELLKIGSAG